MQIKTATFIISRGKEVFTVELQSQQTDGYRRQAIVSVNNGEGKNELYESITGRQVFCTETAKNAIRKVIKQRANV